ncbi:MAG: YdbL family protein [Thermodesulfobacteriota bacterium]|nr:YdbL family protein [Thermodesulfobacteriota bacterium]
MKTRTFVFCILTAGLVLLAASFAMAGEADDIKARMKERLGTIDSLKAQGLIGENNQGLLELRKTGGKGADIVAEENRDRMVVYQAIARKTGATVEKVGARRALQIRETAAPGTWIQTDDGEWQKK